MGDPIHSNICGKLECEVSRTGVCVEGHKPPQACPFFGKAPDTSLSEQSRDDEAALVDSQATPERTLIPLPSGNALSVAEVDDFLRSKPLRFVNIVGEFGSGKSTLICSIYDRFLRGEFAGFAFAGSRTLVGLEKYSHHSRIDSGRIAPETQRTSLSDGLRYFHFAIVEAANPQARVDLMISDRAGEHYQRARDSSDIVPSLIEVKKAHHTVLLLDGDRLAVPFERSGAMQSVRQTLRAFLDAGALNSNSRVQVVTTKIDRLASHSVNSQLPSQIETFNQGLKRDYAHRLCELSFWQIAARDPEGKFEPGFGVDRLMQSWCAPATRLRRRDPIRVTLHSEFDLLLSRTPMKEVP